MPGMRIEPVAICSQRYFSAVVLDPDGNQMGTTV